MDTLISNLPLLTVALLLLIFAARSCIVIVAEHEARIVFFLGRYSRTLPPGLNLMIPLFELASQPIPLFVQSLTGENIPLHFNDGTSVGIDFKLDFRIVDPLLATMAVSEIAPALAALTRLTLADQSGTFTRAALSEERREFLSKTLTSLKGSEKGWGVEVSNLEIVVPSMDRFRRGFGEKQ